jgi:hypothetical protein
MGFKEMSLKRQPFTPLMREIFKKTRILGIVI